MTPALRAQVLREWQPATDPNAFQLQRDPSPLHGLVPQVMKQLGLEQRLHQSQVFHLWPQIVGPLVARMSKPYSLRNGRLEVHVEHSGYIQELRPHKALMLQKISAHVGANVVRDILFRVG